MRTAGTRGFTLLEVLAALMVFALAAVVLSAAYLNVLISYDVVGRGTGDDQEIAFARGEVLAQSDLQTVLAGDEYDTSDGGDPTRNPPRHVKWTADVEPTGTTDLFTVNFTVAITDSDTNKTRTVNETFKVLRPTWSVPTDRSTLRQNAITRIEKAQGKIQ